MIVPLFETADRRVSDEHIKALRNLAYVRETMANAGAFTTIPGWGMVAMGLSAIVASLIAMNIYNPEMWILVWMVEALIALSVGMVSICHKNKTLGLTIFHGIGRRFLINLFMPICAAIPLTYFLWSHGFTQNLAGLWLLLYGTSVITAGSYSYRIMLLMGGCFVMLGCLGLIVTVIPQDILMLMGFGLLHFIFGTIVVLQQQPIEDEHEHENEETH